MELYFVNDGYYRHECLTGKVDSNTFYTKHWVCFSICICFPYYLEYIFCIEMGKQRRKRGIDKDIG